MEMKGLYEMLFRDLTRKDKIMVVLCSALWFGLCYMVLLAFRAEYLGV